jgi:hypothetical protein
MKTLSVRFRFVVIGVIAIVAVVSCCYFPSIPDPRISSYSVEIGSEQRGIYRDWKDKRTFDEALDQVCAVAAAHHATYDFHVKLHDQADDIYPYKKCRSNPPGNIRTVKVTKSKVADDIAVGESAANDPNAMHRIQSSDPGDIKKVLDELQK